MAKTIVLIGLGVGSARADRTPTIDPGAAEWVFVGPIGTASLGLFGARVEGDSRLAEYLGPHPDDRRADASYEDASSGLFVKVMVLRSGRTGYLDHLAERQFRLGSNGRLPSNVTRATIAGHTVLFWCDTPPDCKNRHYMWRSGTAVEVDVEADATIYIAGTDSASDEWVGPAPPISKHIACPEPTAVLEAYLNRYPPLLAKDGESDDRARQWLRDSIAIELDAADFELGRLASAPAEDHSEIVDSARMYLENFATRRAQFMDGPDPWKEIGRLAKATSIPAMMLIRYEYRKWWTAHRDDAIRLP